MELWAYDPYNEWPEMMAPSRLWNQDFGSGLFNEPMFGPFDLPRSVYRRRPTKLSKSEVVSDKDKFQVSETFPTGRWQLIELFSLSGQVTIDLADFEVKEISVKIIDNSLVVHAEHEEKPDEAGHVYRKLNRRYILPRTVDQDNISSTFSDNGTLVITAPKKPKEQSVRGSLQLVLDCTIFQIFTLISGQRAYC